MGLEQIIRPFTDQGVSPRAFDKPGEASTPMVRLAIGFQGSVKTMSYSLSWTVTLSMFQQHTEKKPQSVAAQQALQAAALKGSNPPVSD